jgi:hypothetical protein
LCVQYLAQRDELRQMGAMHVVMLTPAGALNFERSVLDRLGVAANQAEAIIRSLESNDCEALHGVASPSS